MEKDLAKLKTEKKKLAARVLRKNLKVREGRIRVARRRRKGG